jgi:hypothetical protein
LGDGDRCADDAAGFEVVGAFAWRELACGFDGRGFFRSGLVCLATLSHSARSSSLKLRLRRAAGGESGIVIEGRFIGDGDNDSDGKDAPRERL